MLKNSLKYFETVLLSVNVLLAIELSGNYKTETGKQNLPQEVDENKAIEYVIENKEKEDQITMQINEDNKKIIDLDKIKGYIKGKKRL